MYKVVCGFNGTVYSRHRSLKTAERSANKMRRSLDHPNCGSLAGYVQVVNVDAYFTNIADADNEFGCCQVSQKFWKN